MRYRTCDVIGLGKIVSFVALFSMMTAASWAEVISGLAWIVDGDTLEINGIAVRLHGIDAPEKGQSCKNAKGKLYGCGEKATEALKKITEGETVTCNINGRDRYGRLLGTCYFVSMERHWGDVLGASLKAMGGASEREVQQRLNRNPPKRSLLKLNSWLVEKGYALAYRRYSTKYVQQEIEAKTKRRGIWKGEFIEPWRWRRTDRAEDQDIVRIRREAEQGNTQAQARLGFRYANGKGVSRDHQEAVKWYRKAAERGHTTAQNNLGGMYFNGEGVRQSYRQAVKWYRLAAEQGLVESQYNLGVMYAKGEGMPEDYSTVRLSFHDLSVTALIPSGYE